MAIVKTGLIHRWEFLDTDGTFRDSVGSVDITNSGCTALAAETNGARAGILLGTVDTPAGDTATGAGSCIPSGTWTVEVVFRNYGGSVAAYYNIMGNLNSSSRGVYLSRYGGYNNKWAFTASHSAGGTKNLVLQPAGYNGQKMGCLHHAVMTFSGTELNAYLASLEESTVSATPEATEATTREYTEGDNMEVGSEGLDADSMIAEFRIYNKVLTEAEINQNHAADIARHSGGEIWVNASAGADGDGTEGAPYNDIQSAWHRLNTGMTVNLLAGSYSNLSMSASTNSPSAVEGVSFVGASAATVTINDGGTSITYPFSADEGSWTFSGITFDADDTAGYCAFFDVEASAATFTDCIFVDAKDNGSDGSGVMCRTKLTMSGCTVSGCEEHGVYVRLQNGAAADIHGCSVAATEIKNCAGYAIQISNEGTTKEFVDFYVVGNYIHGMPAACSGGIVFGGCDGAFVVNNIIETLSASASNGIKTGYTTIASHDSVVANNTIIEAFIGLHEGDGSATPDGNRWVNNILSGCGTDWNAESATNITCEYNTGEDGTLPSGSSNEPSGTVAFIGGGCKELTSSSSGFKSGLDLWMTHQNLALDFYQRSRMSSRRDRGACEAREVCCE
jgi:hypothetical protein